MFRMLIIEDSPRFRETVKMVLSAYFPSVVIDEAADGKEAMEKIELFFPNLIFSDIRLPGENGIKLTRRIRDSYPNIPIVILTSCDMPEYERAAYQAGARFFMAKSSSTGEQLARLVETVMLHQGEGLSDAEPEYMGMDNGPGEAEARSHGVADCVEESMAL